MKLLRNFLLAITIMLCSGKPNPFQNLKNRVQSIQGVGSQTLLQYIGAMTGMINVSIGVTVYIDTTIGVRYEVVYEQGTSVLSHVALFFHFSNPSQVVLYDFLKHESTVKNSGGGGPGYNAKLSVLGSEGVDSFTCTHLQEIVPKGVTDYWMSPSLPGFSQIVNTLRSINTNLPGLAFNGTIFRWGGLVEMTHNFADSKTGKTLHAELNLKEANTGVTFRAKTFDIPTN